MRAWDLEPSTVVPVTLEEVVPMMESGVIQDAKSIASLLLALRVLSKN